jgi:hypothetical protein
MPDPQHDHHVRLNVGGEAWAIRHIHAKRIYLWRGRRPKLEFNAVDMSGVDYGAYNAAALQLLYPSRPGPLRGA